MRIVIAVGDAGLRSRLSAELTESGCAVIEVSDGLALIKEVFGRRPDAVVLDVEAPPVRGEELLKMIHAAAGLPVVVLLPEANAARTVDLLDIGAADVAAYDTASRELAARVRALVRRAGADTSRDGGPGSEIVRTGNIEFDRMARAVRKGGEYVSLTPTEYRLLEALASANGLVASHDLLLTSVWGDAGRSQSHHLRVYVSHLRNKLEDGVDAPKYIVSDRGVGYRLALLPVEVGRLNAGTGAAAPIGDANEPPQVAAGSEDEPAPVVRQRYPRGMSA